MPVSAVPAGHNRVSPYLLVPGVSKLIEFITKTFEAEEVTRMAGPNGTVFHAELRIGDSIVMMGEPMGEFAAMPAQIHCYVADVDTTYARALAAGGISKRAPEDMFYGDRISSVTDPFGNIWAISTHREDVTPEEMTRRMGAMRKG